MDKKHWDKFYKRKFVNNPSSFARFILPFMKKDDCVLELGCGNGRDTHFFHQMGLFAFGIDESFQDSIIAKMDFKDYIKEAKSPKYVYTRFFWHAITRQEQLKILNWVSDYIFIEARTIQDSKDKKVFGQHYRNYLNVPQLVKDLKNRGFEIEWLKEGRGLSPFKKEDPHLVRIIARKRT